MEEIKQDADISKTTITVLVILTLMISVIGTWTVLNEISNYRSSPSTSSQSTGVARLGIQSTESVSKQSTTANVALQIE